MMLGELIGHGANFFLGVCVLLGAAYVFQRSKRAALFVALAGLGYALDVPLEYFVGHMGMQMHLDRVTVQLFFTFVNVARHVVFFGGLALGMRVISKVPA